MSFIFCNRLLFLILLETLYLSSNLLMKVSLDVGSEALDDTEAKPWESQ
jgi:hypothetical protein